MAYTESNDHVINDVTCPVFLFGTDDILSCHFQKWQNYLEIWNNSKYDTKTAVYHSLSLPT